MKIDTITAFTHPFDYELQEPEKSSRKTLDREYVPIMKNAFHSAGLQVKHIKENPNGLFIFTPTSGRNIREFEVQQQRFIKWAKKTLGSRFILATSYFGYYKGGHNSNILTAARTDESITEMKTNLDKFEFSAQVKLKLGGQLKDYCVTTSGNRIEEILKARSTKVNKEFLQHTKKWNELIGMRHNLLGTKFTVFSKWRRKAFGKRKPKHKKP
jgi:hypothetical protein